eukprot:9343660-Pyramimonas_sp.AAC.1
MQKEELADIISYFRVKKAYTDPGQAQKWKLRMMFNALAATPWTGHNEGQVNAIRTGNELPQVKLGNYT